MNKASFFIFLFSLFVAVGVRAQKNKEADTGETIVEQRINAQTRLLPLKKVTVGPFDNYDADLVGDALLYTRKSDLSPFLYQQSLKTQKAKHLFSAEEDAEQVVVSSDEKWLAFVYYKNRSFGQICVRPSSFEKSIEMKCIDHQKNYSVSSPIWLGSKTIGFLRTNNFSQRDQLVSYDLANGKINILLEGKIGSPASSESGRYVVYTKSLNGVNKIFIRENHDQVENEIKVDLPGVSGLPSLSSDEKYVYFSQFIDDSNGDQVVDGNDHSVVYRLRTDQALKSELVFPEPMTSFEQNCSFPKQKKNRLYLTCAFQGSLDIYELPVGGMVPSQWGVKTLEEAHRAARSYQERLLILQSMRFRYPKLTKNFVERAASNYLQSENFNALEFYLNLADSSVWLKDLVEGLRIYAESEKAKRTLLSEEVTPRFRRLIEAQQKKVSKLQSKNLRSTLFSYLYSYLGQRDLAIDSVAEVRFSPVDSPALLSLYFNQALHFIETEKEISQKAKLMKFVTERMDSFFSHKKLSVQSRVFFGVRLLRVLNDSQVNVSSKINLTQKLMESVSEDSIKTLFSAELFSLKIVSAKEKSAKQVIYRELDKIIRKTRDRYFLKRAIYSRSVYTFTKYNEFQYLNFVANNWMRFTKKGEIEFSFAREHLVFAVRDRAYSNYGKGNLKLADNHFYQAARLTDDLESHYGYVRVMLEQKQKEVLQKRYEDLEKRKFVKENLKFVEAVLLVKEDQDHLLSAPDLEKAKKDTSRIEKAIELVESIQGQIDSPLRALLLGYCQLDLMLRTADGYRFDIDLMQGAHRNLMLAMDLGNGNERVEASALFNLALLHFKGQSHRLAVKFFELRKNLPFVDQFEERAFYFYWSSALYNNHEPGRAYEVLHKYVASAPAALEKGANKKNSLDGVFFERRAFFAFASGKYERAATHYDELLRNLMIEDSTNLAKAHLNFGLSLKKIKKEEKAKSVLLKGWQILSSVKKREKNDLDLLTLNPLRLQLHYLGLLAQLSKGIEKIDFLEKRYEKLKMAAGDLDSLSMREDKVLLYKIKNQWQISYGKQSVRKSHQAEVLKAIELTRELGELDDVWIGETFYESVTNSHLVALAGKDKKVAKESLRLSEKVLEDYIKQENPASLIQYQTVKMQILRSAVQKLVGEKGKKLAEILDGPWAKASMQDSKFSADLLQLQKDLKL